jgi:carboxylate-amine ligase
LSLDLDLVRERFESSTDFTIGLEEEFAILDPATLELEHRFEEVYAACEKDELLAESAAGELIAAEVEIRSGRAESFAEAMAKQQQRRQRLFELVDGMGLALGATGTHPWASYLDQRIIDTPHYNRLRHELGWVAQRNNTWSTHVHMGVRGADRAIAVCDRMRELLPLLLATSANSPFLDRRDSGLHTVRTEIFTRTFPRCGIPSPFRDWDSYAGFVEMLERTGSIVESTQLWWSVRPHHHFGTVEVRICDAQTRGDESFALAGLIAACIAQAALDYDEHGYDGAAGAPLADREIEENLWRAIRHGLSGRMIDFRRGVEVEARAALDAVLAWVEPARSQLGIELRPPERNGAQRAREALDAGLSIEDIYRDAVAETKRTYAGAAETAKSS